MKWLWHWIVKVKVGGSNPFPGLQQWNEANLQIVPDTMIPYTDANKSIFFLLGDDTDNVEVCTTV
jgi:hypothetical protein